MISFVFAVFLVVPSQSDAVHQVHDVLPCVSVWKGVLCPKASMRMCIIANAALHVSSCALLRVPPYVGHMALCMCMIANAASMFQSVPFQSVPWCVCLPMWGICI